MMKAAFVYIQVMLYHIQGCHAYNYYICLSCRDRCTV